VRGLALGPLQLLVIECGGTEFNDAIRCAIASAVECDSLHIVDAAVVLKNAHGKVTIRERSERETRAFAASGAVGALLSVEEITTISARVSSSSSAIIMVVGHTSTRRLKMALAGNGRICLHERVSPTIAFTALGLGDLSLEPQRRTDRSV
jgi:hypothetical protein